VTFQKKIRAMDRRRFVPSTEGLEGRALMASTSTGGLNTLFGVQVNTNLNVPITLQQKELRIEHLPYFLGQIRPGRFIPKAEIEQIQSSLFNMIDSINRPPPQALNNYNYQLRQIVSKQSLTAGDIALLNRGVTAVLRSAHAPEPSVNGISNGLLTLTSQVDTASVQPVVLGSNDNTLVLETALAIGRPMPPPQLPRIKKNQGIQADTQHIKTPLEHPTLVGTYHYHTIIQIVTPQGVVVGEANCARNNNYKVTFSTPQSVGVHEFQLRAEDDAGHLSRLGAKFLIKVVPKKHKDTTVGKATPQGPLATTKS
jgi:hypothetical protein